MISPQGTAASSSLSDPVASATGTGEFTSTFGNSTVMQCDILCGAQYDIAASGTVTIDLYANGLPNIFGGTANFLHLRALFIGIASGGDATGIVIGNAGTNPNPLFFGSTSGTWKITATGMPLQGSDQTGTVVSSTSRNLLITNAGAVTASVLVMLGGTST